MTSNNLNVFLKDIANAIREKKGTTESINAQNFKPEILSIETATPIEVATAAEMDALLVTGNIGKVYKFVGTTGDTYTKGELYQVIEEA